MACILREWYDERRDDPIAAPFGGSKMNEENLVFVVFDDAGKLRAAPDQVARSELAFEHGVLQMIAETPHGLEDLAKPLVVANVVTNIGLPHFNSFSLKPISG
jgi:hypothetical protein